MCSVHESLINSKKRALLPCLRKYREFLVIMVFNNLHPRPTWREVEKAGEISIIDANTAIEKLKQNEIVEKLAGSEKYPIEINEIEIGYYSETTGTEQAYYKPVWVFKGKDGLGYDIVRCVYAT